MIVVVTVTGRFIILDLTLLRLRNDLNVGIEALGLIAIELVLVHGNGVPLTFELLQLDVLDGGHCALRARSHTLTPRVFSHDSVKAEQQTNGKLHLKEFKKVGF